MALRVQGVSRLAFQFPSPTRLFVDVFELGRALDGRRLDETPATRDFLEGNNEFLVVDAVLMASEIKITTNTRSGESSGLSLDSVASVSQSRDISGGLTLSSTRPLPFAFSSLRLSLGTGGAFVGLRAPEKTGYRTVGFGPSGNDDDADFPYEILTRSNELLDLE
jgi:hypothetical protein